MHDWWETVYVAAFVASASPSSPMSIFVWLCEWRHQGHATVYSRESYTRESDRCLTLDIYLRGETYALLLSIVSYKKRAICSLTPSRFGPAYKHREWKHLDAKPHHVTFDAFTCSHERYLGLLRIPHDLTETTMTCDVGWGIVTLPLDKRVVVDLCVWATSYQWFRLRIDLSRIRIYSCDTAYGLRTCASKTIRDLCRSHLIALFICVEFW